MASHARTTERVFKTAWFAKAAKKALIPDKELCAAIAQVMLGQADDLGGGVYKKRLDKNRYRSIILCRTAEFWVYGYLFAKKDRASISNDELVGFRMNAKSYTALTGQQLIQLLQDKDWTEICHGEQE